LYKKESKYFLVLLAYVILEAYGEIKHISQVLLKIYFKREE